jgi:predicted RNA methylase
MKDELLESIKKMIVNGNRLELPKDEQFSNYPAVKRCLLDAGGKYKKCGFEFSDDAQEVKTRLVGGEVINDKKKFQFFATPKALAEVLIDMADIDKTHRVLEPSAGQGSISNLVRDIGAECVVVELMPENAKALTRQGYDVINGCFLEQTPEELGLFDRIVANPPFTKNQDIDHIKKMFSLLLPGGKLISMASKSWIHGSQKKQVAFREWLENIGGTITDVDAGSFKESGTNIASVIVEAEYLD